VVPAGQRFGGFVQICDWLPTVLDVLGVPRADPAWTHMQGTSLTPTWSGRDVRPFAVAEYMKPLQTIERALRHDPDFDFRLWLRRWKAIRTHEYKYHWASDGQDMLFDVRADPGERRNLAAERPEQVRQMQKMLEDFLMTLDRRDFGDAMRNHGFRNVRWDNVDRLRAWGVYRDVTPFERPGH
jgi:arylsulfatase A-like enzyme